MQYVPRAVNPSGHLMDLAMQACFLDSMQVLCILIQMLEFKICTFTLMVMFYRH